MDLCAADVGRGAPHGLDAKQHVQIALMRAISYWNACGSGPSLQLTCRWVGLIPRKSGHLGRRRHPRIRLGCSRSFADLFLPGYTADGKHPLPCIELSNGIHRPIAPPRCPEIRNWSSALSLHYLARKRRGRLDIAIGAQAEVDRLSILIDGQVEGGAELHTDSWRSIVISCRSCSH